MAVAIASSLGLTIGYLVGRSRYATLVFEPLLAGVFAVPLVVFLPLFILFFGIGVESKIAFGASYAFFPIVLNTIGGISQVDPRFVTVARSMGASERQLFPPRAAAGGAAGDRDRPAHRLHHRLPVDPGQRNDRRPARTRQPDRDARRGHEHGRKCSPTSCS